MKIRGLVLLAGAFVGCTSNQLRTELPPAAREDPQGFVVVTIRNPVILPGSHAASTARGYDAVGAYAAGSTARAAGRALAADYRLREVSSWPIALLGVNCLTYGLPSGADRTQVLAVLRRDPRVESAQPLLAFETASGAYNDPYANLQNNIQDMAIVEAQTLSRGASVRVAVIDTGADMRHPDLPGNIVARNFVDNDTDAFQDDAHGTAVAGVIAAIPNNGVGIAGIAPDVRLLLYKACWRAAATGIKAACNSFTLAQALSAAIEAHADIINLSLAGPSDPLLTRLIERAAAAGIIVVGAVPPDGLRDSFPTNINSVIAVDALESGHDTAGVLRAPGRDVVSLAPHAHYDFYSGSSLATAEVSGLVALLRAQRPSLTAQDARTLLLESEPSASAGASPPNACAALESLVHGKRCASR